jgi:hypothetical protein
MKRLPYFLAIAILTFAPRASSEGLVKSGFEPSYPGSEVCADTIACSGINWNIGGKQYGSSEPLRTVLAGYDAGLWTGNVGEFTIGLNGVYSTGTAVPQIFPIIPGREYDVTFELSGGEKWGTIYSLEVTDNLAAPDYVISALAGQPFDWAPESSAKVLAPILNTLTMDVLALSSRARSPAGLLALREGIRGLR